MPRVCTVCQHIKRAEIDRRLANGEPSAAVAGAYGLGQSSVHRHRANCAGLGSAREIKKEAARGSAAATLSLSKEKLSEAYSDLRAEIDGIVAQAKKEGSLKVALSGLNSLRQTFDSQGRLAALIEADAAQKGSSPSKGEDNFDKLASRLIERFDKEPDLRARVAEAILEVDNEQVS